MATPLTAGLYWQAPEGSDAGRFEHNNANHRWDELGLAPKATPFSLYCLIWPCFTRLSSTNKLANTRCPILMRPKRGRVRGGSDINSGRMDAVVEYESINILRVSTTAKSFVPVQTRESFIIRYSEWWYTTRLVQ